MDFADIGLRLVGAFYVFAGVVATRAAMMSHILDRALAGIGGGQPTATERAQAAWLIIASLIVLAGGAALVLKLDWAVWLFLLSACSQALYLFVVAPRWFDIEDAPDPVGRQRTTNAFVVYLAATALVAWAFASGRLLHADQVAPPVVLGVVAAVIGYVGYAAWMMRPWRGS